MTHLEIESDLFVALGCLIAGERSDLSPLPIYNTGLVSPEQHQRLLQSGLLEETDGTPTSELNLMLEALRTAQSSASLLITTQDEQKEYQIYYPPDGFSPVIMMLDQNKIIISCAGNAEQEIIASLKRLPVPTTEVTASFSCSLTAMEAESLAVIIDLNRQASSQFTGQADSSPQANPVLAYKANQIYQASQTRADSSPDLWLFSILFSMLVFGEEGTFPQIEQALAGLVAAGLVESKEQGYLLSDQAAKYTRSFSNPLGALILNVSTQPAEAPVRTESLAIFTAGEGSLVLQSTSDESLLVNPLPPARVLEIATQALRKPISLGNSIQAEATVIDLRPANVEIIVLSGKLEYQRFPVGDQLRLGREADNDLTLPDEKASRHHAILQRQGMVYQIIDMNSGNGTYVNGQRISQPTVLKDGDIILIGTTKISFNSLA